MMLPLVLRSIAETRRAILYRPEFNQITGSVTASILLQQVIFWADHSDGQPFYKFIQPCRHESYRNGDSWCEEIGFSRKEFASAIAKIGTKITKGESKAEAFNEENPENLVIYWTDSDRVTWWQLNIELAESLISGIYLGNVPKGKYLGKSPKGKYPVSDKRGNTCSYTENTTEITSESENSLFSNGCQNLGVTENCTDQKSSLPVAVSEQIESINGADLKSDSLRNSESRSSITQKNQKEQGSGEKAKIQKEAPPSAAAPPRATAKRSTDMGGLMGKRTDHRAIAANYISLFESEQEEDDFYRWAIAYLKNQGDSQPEKSADIAVMCLKTAHKASPRHKEMLSSFRENPTLPEAKSKSMVMGDIEELQQLAKQNPLEARQRAIALAKSKGYPENFFILRAKLNEL